MSGKRVAERVTSDVLDHASPLDGLLHGPL
jgi:hypothetical protein